MPNPVPIAADVIVSAAGGPEWRNDAACQETTTAVFYVDKNQPTGPAAAVCHRCPVVDECLAYALLTPEIYDHGIWGNTSVRTRIRLRRLGVTIRLTCPRCLYANLIVLGRGRPTPPRITCRGCGLRTKRTGGEW